MYSIFYTSNGAYVSALNTANESEARECVESLRIAGKEVLIKRDGKRINWRYTQRALVHRGQSELYAAYAKHLQG